MDKQMHLDTWIGNRRRMGVGNMGEIQVKPGAGSGTFAVSYLTHM